MLARTSGAGTKGSEIQRSLATPLRMAEGRHRWSAPRLALEWQHPRHAGQAASRWPEELPATQIGKAVFFKEDEPPSMAERMAVRGLLTEAKIPYTTGQEGAAISGLLQHLLDLAGGSGGEAPLPPRPDTTHIEGIEALAGNQQFRDVAKSAEPPPTRQRELERSLPGKTRPRSSLGSS